MATTTLAGQVIELGTTNPPGVSIGAVNSHRKLINWNIPNRGLVEMYVNPRNLVITEAKITKEQRTKGGYIIQYWGEQLPKMTLSGTTGSGGVEGINILRDIYRQEQVGFVDIVTQLNSNFFNNLIGTTLGSIQGLSNNPLSNPLNVSNIPTSPDQFFNGVAKAVSNVANVLDTLGAAITADQQLIPTLAALATSVEMWYDGKIYRGFFTEFNVTESADEMLFRYDLKFTITRQLGIRHNDFAWQREPSAGPANSDVIPFTFGALATPESGTQIPGAPGVTIAPPTASRRGNIIGG